MITTVSESVTKISFFRCQRCSLSFLVSFFFILDRFEKKKCFRLFRDQSGEINVASLLVV